jgi:hypothetical protein
MTAATEVTKAVVAHRPIVAMTAALALVAAFALPVSATAPSNDGSASPRVIGSIPFTHGQDTTDATSDSTDPGYCLAPEFGTDPASVWFRYTASATGSLGATTFGSDYDTTLYVGTANGAGGIDVIACNDDVRTLQAAIRFDAHAGETYLFAVGTSPFAGVNGGNLVFNLDVGPVAQAVSLAVDPVGSVSKGVVMFSGTVSCSAEATLGSIVIAELAQTQGSKEALGVGFHDVTGCPGSGIPFTIEVPSEVGKFKAGLATAQFIYAACNDFECGNETIDIPVTLEKQ